MIILFITQKIRIYPNKTTINLFNRYFGYSRYCFNKGLSTWKTMYELNEKPNGRKVRDNLKSNKEEWEKELSPQILDTSIEDLDKAFKMFFKHLSKYPKLKSRKKSKDTFRIYRKSDSSIRTKNNKLFLPKFPYGIKLSESIKYEGIIKTCTISKKADKYFVLFSIQLSEKEINSNFHIDNEKSVGIDLGIKEFAILSYGDLKFQHIKSNYNILKPLYNKISYYQKRMSKKVYNSNKYNVMKLKLQNTYLDIKNIQDDFLHKITTDITSRFKYITIENLNISGMIKNRCLSEKISKSLFYTFKVQLKYKSEIYGNQLIIADRWFASTQICSNCGCRKINENKLKLSDRIYICPECGNIMNRDENAANNLKIYGERQVGLQP